MHNTKHTLVLTVVTTALNASFAQTTESATFDTDSTTFVMDNSATGFIFNDKSPIQGDLCPVTDADAVATIGGVDNYPDGEADIKISWKDDNGILHSHVFRAHCFPNSPVNVFSVTMFAKMLQDREDTCIKTRAACSAFVWDFGKCVNVERGEGILKSCFRVILRNCERGTRPKKFRK